MSLRVGSDFNGDGLDSITPLPLHQTTHVRFEALGSDIVLFLNYTADNAETLYGVRHSGKAALFVSSPWYPSALAIIGSIQMTPISTFSYFSPDIGSHIGPLTRLDPGIVEQISVYNGFNDICGTGSSVFSSSGCGPMLQCNRVGSESKCQHSDTFNNLLKNTNSCPYGSELQTGQCQVCRSYLTTCNNGQNNCCRGSTCAAVDVVIDGKLSESGTTICLPDQDSEGTLADVRDRLFSYSCSNGKCLGKPKCGLGEESCVKYYPENQVFYKNSFISIYNSIGDTCGTSNTNGLSSIIGESISSDSGCGANLICSKNKCAPNNHLKKLTTYNINKPISPCGKSSCPRSSHCDSNKCQICRDIYSICGSSSAPNGYGCCQGSTCTAVEAIVNGQNSTVEICLPTEAESPATSGNAIESQISQNQSSQNQTSQNQTSQNQTSQNLSRRMVQKKAIASVKYCYSKCPANAINVCPLGKSVCINVSSVRGNFGSI